MGDWTDTKSFLVNKRSSEQRQRIVLMKLQRWNKYIFAISPSRLPVSTSIFSVYKDTKITSKESFQLLETGVFFAALVPERQPSLPLHKYPSLHCMDNALEPRLLLAPSEHHPHLPGEGGGQPVSDLRRHCIRLNVTELILRIQKSPEHRKHNQDTEITPAFGAFGTAVPFHPTWIHRYKETEQKWPQKMQPLFSKACKSHHCLSGWFALPDCTKKQRNQRKLSMLPLRLWVPDPLH